MSRSPERGRSRRRLAEGRRPELPVILGVALLLLALPVLFLLGIGQPERRAPASRPGPEAEGAPAAGLGSVPGDDGPDRVTDQEAQRALAALEETLAGFDRSVSRIEAARRRGEYHGASGDPEILLRVFAPVKENYLAALAAAGAPVGYGLGAREDIELTPLRSAYVEAALLPDAVERAWLGSRDLAELEARALVRRAVEAARDWVEDR